MEIYTIGFTQTTAEHFFRRLADAGIARLLDVRLNNSSQLAGFAKAQDLPYFLRELVGAEYEHEPCLRRPKALLDDYKKRKGSWAAYEQGFMALMAERGSKRCWSPSDFEAPHSALVQRGDREHCHRRLVCEYLAKHWPDVRAVHL